MRSPKQHGFAGFQYIFWVGQLFGSRPLVQALFFKCDPPIFRYIYIYIHILIAFCSNIYFVPLLGWSRRQGYPDACDSMFLFFRTSRAWQEGTKATGIDVVHFPVEVSHPMLGHPMAMAVFFWHLTHAAEFMDFFFRSLGKLSSPSVAVNILAQGLSDDQFLNHRYLKLSPSGLQQGLPGPGWGSSMSIWVPSAIKHGAWHFFFLTLNGHLNGKIIYRSIQWWRSSLELGASQAHDRSPW